MVLHPQPSAGRYLKWTESTPFIEPRAGYAAGAIEGKLIIAGGTYWEGTKGCWTKKVFSASTHAFDPKTRIWEKLPDAPVPFGYAASTVINDELFVLGGHTPLSPNRHIFILKRKLNRYSWELFGEMPEDRMFAQAVSVGESIYLIGGTTNFEPYDSAGNCCTSRTATNSLMALDTRHRETGWRQLPPYPGAKRWLFAAETDGESIWLFGGVYQAEQRDPVTKFNEVLRYRLADRRWSVMPFLPAENGDAPVVTALLVENRIVLISNVKKAWQFNLEVLRYEELTPLPQAAFIDKFVYLDHMIIGAGGENSVEGPRKRSEWTFVGYLEPDL